jgi:Zn-dependent alcohol dehydrogenase
MPKLMKAAVVRSFGKPLTIEEVAIPTPGPGEVLVSMSPQASATRVVKPAMTRGDQSRAAIRSEGGRSRGSGDAGAITATSN